MYREKTVFAFNKKAFVVAKRRWRYRWTRPHYPSSIFAHGYRNIYRRRYRPSPHNYWWSGYLKRGLPGNPSIDESLRWAYTGYRCARP